MDSQDQETLLILPDLEQSDLEMLVDVLTCVPGLHLTKLQLEAFDHLHLNIKEEAEKKPRILSSDNIQDTETMEIKYRDDPAELVEINGGRTPDELAETEVEKHVIDLENPDAQLASLQTALDLSHVIQPSLRDSELKIPKRRKRSHYAGRLEAQSNSQNLTSRIHCHVCHDVFPNRDELIQHLKTDHQAAPFKCSRCRKSFADSRELEEHQAIHDILTVNLSFTCDTCNKSYTTMNILNQHKKDKHSNLKFLCPVSPCMAVFSAQRYLKEHMSKKHSDSTKPVCPICQKTFSGKHELRVHTTIHTGERPFKCETCSKSFRTKSVLTLHLKMHYNIKDVVCDECGQGFVQKGDLTKHMRLHTGSKPFACEECDKVFSRKDYLAKHSRSHMKRKAKLDLARKHEEVESTDVLLGEISLEDGLQVVRILPDLEHEMEQGLQQNMNHELGEQDIDNELNEDIGHDLEQNISHEMEQDLVMRELVEHPDQLIISEIRTEDPLVNL